MGASSWAYFVPYQTDIKRTLQELRQKVFQSGEYYLRPQMEVDLESYKNMPKEVREQAKLRVEREKPFSKPTSITALLEWNGEEGTHSIIDVENISSAPMFNAVAPLSKDQLVYLFGTDKPDRSIVQEKAKEILTLRKRWEGAYIIIYKSGIPDEIFFTGFSGD